MECKNCGKTIERKNCKIYCNQKCYFDYKKKNQHSYDNLYRRYKDMKSRCYNKNNCNYKYYGARGIIICNEWLGENGYDSFKNWSLENGYKKELSLDKINNDGNYEPNNCRWATSSIQNINMRHKNSSGFVGIGKHTAGNYYYGYVKYQNKGYYTGLSKNIIESAIMRNNFIIDNCLPNKLNNLDKYKNDYNMELRYEKK